jgi:hypothetical protein
MSYKFRVMDHEPRLRAVAPACVNPRLPKHCVAGAPAEAGSSAQARDTSEAPCPEGGASRKGNFVHIVPLDPAYKAGLAGHVPVTR